MIKNHRTILRAYFGTWSIHRGRIVVRPENVEDLIGCYLGRIEFPLNNLGMAGLVAANIFVARILSVPACIPYGGRAHALKLATSLFHAPKTPRPERRFLRRHKGTMERLCPSRKMRACLRAHLPQLSMYARPYDRRPNSRSISDSASEQMRCRARKSQHKTDISVRHPLHLDRTVKLT